MDETPLARRAAFPDDYGMRGGEGDELLDWADVEGRIAAAPNYWILTAGPDGSPHGRPIDGVWVGGALCFGGSPATRWVRNLQADPRAAVHLPSGDDVVILEGIAVLVDDPDHPLAGPSQEASRSKYPQYFGDEPGPFHPFWVLHPRTAYAWSLSSFPKGATRWSFAPA